MNIFVYTFTYFIDSKVLCVVHSNYPSLEANHVTIFEIETS